MGAGAASDIRFLPFLLSDKSGETRQEPFRGLARRINC